MVQVLIQPLFLRFLVQPDQVFDLFVLLAQLGLEVVYLFREMLLKFLVLFAEI